MTTDLRVVGGDLVPPQPERRHLLSIADLTRDDVERLLATARSFAQSQERENKKLPTLRGRLVINVFYESSTRTSSSFELAAKRLSADTMTLKSSGSSVDKGESLKDTALTLSAYDPDVIVLRHPEAGAAELVARQVGDRDEVPARRRLRRPQVVLDETNRAHCDPSSGFGTSKTSSTSSTSTSCTWIRSERAVGRFLPT